MKAEEPVILGSLSCVLMSVCAVKIVERYSFNESIIS